MQTVSDRHLLTVPEKLKELLVSWESTGVISVFVKQSSNQAYQAWFTTFRSFIGSTVYKRAMDAVWWGGGIKSCSYWLFVVRLRIINIDCLIG